jgi:hypothetical protein
LTTSLDPSMTLGCGGYGGNITSDNISPRHLLNIKRLAYETTPVASLRPPVKAAAGTAPLPKAPEKPKPAPGIAASSLAARIDEFLASRGYTPPASGERPPAGPPSGPKEETSKAGLAAEPVVEKAADFVCEEDVRQAVRLGRKILVGDRTIVTPAARDLAEQHKLFVQAGWPR